MRIAEYSKPKWGTSISSRWSSDSGEYMVRSVLPCRATWRSRWYAVVVNEPVWAWLTPKKSEAITTAGTRKAAATRARFGRSTVRRPTPQ